VNRIVNASIAEREAHHGASRAIILKNPHALGNRHRLNMLPGQ
jgi:hypothetical protein